MPNDMATGDDVTHVDERAKPDDSTKSGRPHPPWYARIWPMVRDYTSRVWDNAGEDNIFFLASGISFNLLLAFVPFILLFATVLTYFLNTSNEGAIREVSVLLNHFLPAQAGGGNKVVSNIVSDVINKRGSVGLYSAIGFVWFSTRLFGSLRSVLCSIFDIEQDRGIVAGKAFDMGVTVVASLLLVIYTVISAYIALAATQNVFAIEVLSKQNVLGGMDYLVGRLVAFLFIVILFWGLYKYLPNKKMRSQTALVAALFTSIAFEVAREVFGMYVGSFRPGSFYTGTLAAMVVVVLWVYYASIVFILGNLAAQVYELRRMRRLQLEAFEE